MNLIYLDQAGARVDNKREFPLGDTTNTANLDLFINGFGVGLKTTATLAVTKPADAKFKAKSLKATAGLNWAYSGLATKASESSGVAAGMVSYKIAKNTWGNTCCAASQCADPGSSNPRRCDLTSGNLKLFAHNGAEKSFSTSYLDSTAN